MTVLGIFIGLIYGLSTVGGIWPSLLAIFAVPLTGAAPLTVTLSSGLGADSSFLMLFMMVVAELLAANDVTKILAFWLWDANFYRTALAVFFLHPLWDVSFGSLGATFGLVIIFWSVTTTVCKEAG